jgi:putative DNA primase/helicase
MTPKESHRRRLQRTWEGAHPLDPADPVMRYLAHRGLALPPTQIPPALRYHPHLRYVPQDEGQPITWHPGMVARIDDAQGRPVNLHRTFLTLDGHKAAVPDVRKWMTPAVEGSTKGGAIRLYRPGDTLAITEGIETALAVHLSTGLPVWAALCASLMAEVMIPATVQLVVICADHDHNQTGLTAARCLASRLLTEGRRVKIVLPETAGTDWLDVFCTRQPCPLTRTLIEATPDVAPDTPDASETPPAIVHHVLPDYILKHPDPRVREHWKRLYRKTAILKERYAREGGLLCQK